MSTHQFLEELAKVEEYLDKTEEEYIKCQEMLDHMHHIVCELSDEYDISYRFNAIMSILEKKEWRAHHVVPTTYE